MPFFEFNQNNSGGNFIFTDRLTHHIVIEAINAEDANTRAEDIGIYFDGCEKGDDCDCCGDRWSSVWGDGNSEPMLYGVPVENFKPWRRKDGPEIFVYYMNGEKKTF